MTLLRAIGNLLFLAALVIALMFSCAAVDDLLR